MKTIMAKFTEDTTLLIKGIKSKFDEQDNLKDDATNEKLNDFIKNFRNLVNKDQ